ncbi:MAG: hypothetical protein Kow009_08290 [Spirochaetales bacterium]
MREVERFLESKTPNPLDCEDMIFLNSHFAGVIDGVTSKKGSKDGIPSTGKKAAELIVNALGGIPFDASKEFVFTILNLSIREYYESRNILKEAETSKDFRCSASVVLYSSFHREVWRVGDCPFLLDGRKMVNRKHLDSLLSELRACYLETEIRMGKTIEELLYLDTGRAYIQELLSRQIVFQNADDPSPYNFEVIDGFFRHLDRIEVYPVPPETRSLVLASDGYPELKPTLRESEEHLKQIISEDPLCFRMFKSTKGVYRGNRSFDDRAYLRLSLED